MADEIKVQFDVQGPPSWVMEEFRNNPPRALVDDRYKLVDESYNSLTYEARYLDWPAMIVVYGTIIGLLFRNLMMSVFRVTARFDEEGQNTRVLLFGTAHPRTQAALHGLIAEHGGPVGPATPSPASTLLPGSPSS